MYTEIKCVLQLDKHETTDHTTQKKRDQRLLADNSSSLDIPITNATTQDYYRFPRIKCSWHQGLEQRAPCSGSHQYMSTALHVIWCSQLSVPQEMKILSTYCAALCRLDPFSYKVRIFLHVRKETAGKSSDIEACCGSSTSGLAMIHRWMKCPLNYRRNKRIVVLDLLPSFIQKYPTSLMIERPRGRIRKDHRSTMYAVNAWFALWSNISIFFRFEVTLLFSEWGYIDILIYEMTISLNWWWRKQ